jgi:TP901 family phage tail tape measure protein
VAKKSLNIFVGLNDKSFQKGLKRVSKSLTRFGSKMKRVGSNLTSKVTMPLALAGGASIKMAIDFEASMTKIQTLVGATGEQMNQYAKGVASISSTTAVAQKDLADGLFFITSAGLSGQEALDALEVSAKAGAMGMGEMDSIANALTSVMTAYADENMTAARAGDLLHETLKQGKFDAGQFMDKLGSVIPVAAAAGISMEELGAASATMSKLSGDAAGTLTSMKSLMMALLKPSEQQKEILEGLGLTTDDLGKMMDESLMGTLEFLFQNLEGNNEQLLTMFGSSKAVVGALSTMGLQAETYAEVLDGMNNSQGNVDAGMQTLQQTAGFKLKKAFTELQNVGIELGNILLPVVTKIAKGFSKFLSFFKGLDSSTKKTIVAIGLLAGAIGPVLSIVGTLTTAFGALLSPVGLVVAAIVGGGILIYKNWETFRKLLVDTINYFIDLYNESIGFRIIVESIGFVFKGLVNTIVFFVKAGIALIKGFVRNFTSLFGGIGDIIKGVFTLDYDVLKQGFETAKDALAETFNPDKNPDLKAATDELAEKTAKNFKSAYEGVQGKDPIEYITEDDIQGVVDKAGDMATNVMDKIKSQLGGPSLSFEGGEDGGGGDTAPVGDFEPITGSTFQSIENKNSALLDSMKKGWSEFGETAGEKIQKVGQIFSEIMGSMQAASDQRFQNEFANLDIETQKQIEAVENSSLSEEDKQDRITDIQKDADTKRKAIAQRQAKANKKFAIMGAIVNTAMAVTNALANIPAPFNIPVAIAMGAAGAAQIAAIASAPLPALAEGGLAFGPTAALVGDNVGAATDPEVIAPLSKLNGMMGGSQKVIVEGVIKGEDIFLINKKQTKIQNRIG